MTAVPVSARPLLTLLATAAMLAACGGGGDDASTAAASADASGLDAASPADQRRQALAATQATDTGLYGPAIRRRIPSASPESPLTPIGPIDPNVPIVTTPSTTLVVRAAGSSAGGVWPIMQVRVDGTVAASVEVKSAQYTDYSVKVAALRTGSKVDVVFTNDAYINGEDRNLFVAYLTGAGSTVLPTLSGAIIDKGSGAKAFDGLDTVPGQGAIYQNAALRLTWPAAPIVDATAEARRREAARFLLQAGFGPTPAEVDRLAASTPAKWIDEQVAMPFSADFVDHVQAKYAQSADNRPGGKTYTNVWVQQRFWALAATAPDQLRKRVAFALHHMLMVSLADSNLWSHQRAYANYLDNLGKHAFGNYRTLMEEISLSPVMGIYLSHMRNRKEDPATGRMPDENYARELMQLFSIGLYELNADGSLRLDASGKPIETYNNNDVMALAKVFTGWSWAFPDNQLTESKFRWGSPDYSLANDTRMDLLRMRAYPGQASTSEVRLFTGKPHALVIPAGTSPELKLKAALDTLFNHPNVGPFVGRQLIQQLVTSAPSAAYVGRVAAAFANNGRGVRGDMAAVVRAVLLDPEARSTAPAAEFGKLREPALRVAQWIRAFGVPSTSGEYMIAWEFDALSQRPLNAPSVFGWFRPGYVPPNTRFATRNATAPEFQLVNESTTAAWVNQVEAMFGWGIGWNGKSQDLVAAMPAQIALATGGNLEALAQNLNLLLFAGRMSAALKQDIFDAVGSIAGTDANSHAYRARIAAYVAMTSPEFLAQR